MSREPDGLDGRAVFLYVLRLRCGVLDALRAVPEETLDRDVGTNHRSILRTLIHIMAVEESWVQEDLLGRPAISWEEFRNRYLGDPPSLGRLITSWEAISGATLDHFKDDAALSRRIAIPGPGGTARTITGEQVLLHLAGEEMIHMGEVLAMTRQAGIDLPAYFLLAVMDGPEWPRV